MINPYPVPKSSQKLTIAAWAIVIVVSVLPDIFFVELGGDTPDWLPFAKTGLLFILALAAWW